MTEHLCVGQEKNLVYIPKQVWLMSFRKTILIDHIAMGRGEYTVSWKGTWLGSSFVPWLGPTGCQKNSVFLVRSGKQGETEKEERAGCTQPTLCCHAPSHRNEMGSSVLWCEKKPSQTLMKRKLIAENSVTHLKSVFFSIISLSFLLQNGGIDSQKAAPAGLCCAQAALQNSPALRSTISLQEVSAILACKSIPSYSNLCKDSVLEVNIHKLP